jgi:hypothetical protein
MNVKIRINNIGAEPVQFVGNASDNVEASMSIYKYHPNRYYGGLNDYLNSGWVDAGDFIESQGCKIYKNCFQNVEDKYVIAFVNFKRKDLDTELVSVSDRILYIEPKDREDFFEVYRLTDKFLVEEYCPREDFRL